MKLEMRGNVALVSGSSRGIGRAIAITLADQGCDLLLTGRDAAALQEVAAEVANRGRKACVTVVDLKEVHAPTLLVETAKREFGGLDILVNNAGTTQRGDFFTLTDQDWQDGFALKFFAHVRLARAAWPLLKAASGGILAIGVVVTILIMRQMPAHPGVPASPPVTGCGTGTMSRPGVLFSIVTLPGLLNLLMSEN